MDKLKMTSVDKINENIEKIRAMFPSCVTEVLREGKPTLAVDFEMLKQEMAEVVIDDKEERYQFTWPDKKKSILLANSPISKTLRPSKEESVNFDTTENLYIEGDNLDVLKLLQETYLGKVKMIYIDPPYNTGKDFVYEDDYAMSSEEYLENSNQLDEEGNRLFQNNDSNGRFHTDWLNMIYPRLKLAKDLLSDDGVIFISIDDNEQANLKKVCDEVFGAGNFVAQAIRRTINSGKHDTNTVAIFHEYLFAFAKNINILQLNKKPKTDTDRDALYKETDIHEKERGRFYVSQLNKNSIQYSDSLNFPIKGPDGKEIYPGGGFEDKEWCWRWGKQKVQWGIENDYIVFKKQGDKYKVYAKSYEYRDNNGDPIERTNPYSTLEFTAKEYGNFNATPELSALFDGRKYFDFPKSAVFLKEVLKLSNVKNNEIILDFFSGSATTAHAVMQLNAEDGGNRKFIMVQLPELTDEKSEAYKAGYKNICEIGKERIRRAGKKIKEEHERLNIEDMILTYDSKKIKDIDIGFRVLKLDSSNMKDVYYRPNQLRQDLLEDLTDNIKDDRTSEDLLFQVMLDLGKPLSAKIEQRTIADKHIFIVNDNDLICCFDSAVTMDVVTEIAKLKPLYAVFRDSSLSSDSVSVNFDQIFSTYSSTTIRRVI